MPAHEIRRPIVSVQLLTRFAAAHGVPAARCLRETGITEAELAQTQTEILPRQELQLVRNLVREIGDRPGIGLDAGLQYHLSAYGVWGFALVTSPTLRSAVAVAAQFLDLSYAFLRFVPGASDAQAFELRLLDQDIPEDVRQFLFDRDLAAWANAMREMLPAHLPVLAASFRFPEPSYGARYAALCGVPPQFNAADNVIRFDASHLDQPLPQGDSAMAQLCLAQCRQQLEKRRVHAGIGGRVRDRLLQAPHEMPGIEQVARELNMATRSLRRHLAQENTSFRALVEEVRLLLAEQLLAVPGMKLDEIALRLGYAEPASFIHAFKRWAGVTPQRFRERRR